MSLKQFEVFGGKIISLNPHHIGGLPLLYPVMQNLSIRQIVNRLVPSQAEIDLGRIVENLILNRLLSPVALYGVGEWLAESVLPELLEIEADQVYDNRLGRALDRLHPKLGELWAEIVSRAIQRYDLDLSVLHWDITSIYFEGAYNDSALASYAYSLDPRTDTKQVNLQVARRIKDKCRFSIRYCQARRPTSLARLTIWKRCWRFWPVRNWLEIQ